MAVDAFTFVTVYPLLHPVCVVWFPVLAEDKRDLSAVTFAMVCRGRIAHAAALDLTGTALAQAAFEEDLLIACLVFGDTA